jgi:hypothetical protein
MSENTTDIPQYGEYTQPTRRERAKVAARNLGLLAIGLLGVATFSQAPGVKPATDAALDAMRDAKNNAAEAVAELEVSEDPIGALSRGELPIGVEEQPSTIPFVRQGIDGEVMNPEDMENMQPLGGQSLEEKDVA